MPYSLPSDTSPAPDAAALRRNPAKRQRERLREHIQAHKPQLERYIADHEVTAPDLAIRARSILLYLDGLHCQEIARITGMTPNAVMRVRRRFASWGLPCLADPRT